MTGYKGNIRNVRSGAGAEPSPGAGAEPSSEAVLREDRP